jgi:hypothetical protein
LGTIAQHLLLQRYGGEGFYPNEKGNKIIKKLLKESGENE